eukprot:14071960-Alexandrium_andersonii.AAC.1
MQTLPWQHQRVRLCRRGRCVDVRERRATIFMADPGVCYEYSGRDNAGIQWHPEVLALKQRVEAAV